MAISKIKDTAGNVHDIGVNWDNIIGKPDAFIDFGTCETAAATAAKVVNMTDTDWSLEVGNIIGVKFTNSNSASSVTLNVNNSGATNIYYNNAKYTGNSTSICGYANRVSFYMYDGTYWVWLNMGSLDGNSNTVPCIQIETAAATAAKAGTCTNYSLLAKSYAHANVRYSNTSKTALTLNVNSKGAKPIYINGAASSTSNYTLPAGTYIIYYDGTNYHFRTDGKLPNVDIPTPGNGKITIKQAGTEKGSFTVNQSGDTTIELTDNNSHNTSKNIVGSSSTATANAAVSSNGVYLNHLEQSSVTSSHKISGSGTVTVSSDNNGNITINGSNHPSPGNGTITIKQAGTEKGSFTVNQTDNKTIELTDNNTTYTFATGDSNGQIKVTPSGGSATNISVKGLGSLAYKNNLDDTYVKLNSGSSYQTIYSSGDTPLRVKNTTSTGSTYIGFFNGSDAFMGSIGVTPSKQINFYNGASNTVLHSGNYTDYAASLTGNNTFTGTNKFNNNIIEFASGKIEITDDGDVSLNSEGYIIPGGQSSGFKGNLNGTATKANALTSTSKGSATQPVYFDANGKPVACTYTLGKSVPSNAVFTDTDSKTSTSNKAATKLFLVGATAQSTSGQTTYSNSNCYVGTDNCLYSGGSKVLTSVPDDIYVRSISNTQGDDLTISTEDMVLSLSSGDEIQMSSVGGLFISGAVCFEGGENGENVYMGTDLTVSGTITGNLTGTATNANNVMVNTSNGNMNLPILFTTQNPSTGTNETASNRAVYVDTEKNKFYYNPGNNQVHAAGGFFETSDERLKDIVNPITVDLDKLSKLRKVYFNWKDKPDSDLQLGMIAQDVQELYPELVSEADGQLSLSYEKLSVVALEAIDVLHNENNELKSRIERLESLVNQLAEKVND